MRGKTFYPHYCHHSFTQPMQNCQLCFLLPQQTWIGCGPTDCGGFVLHEGTLTVCSGGRYLNLGDIHMGGREGRCQWHPLSSLLMLKGKQTKGYKLKVKSKQTGASAQYFWCIIAPFFDHQISDPLTLSQQHSFLRGLCALCSCWQCSCTLILTLTSVYREAQ